ncbi:hypothetical protein LX32DRAFT_657043 [Colletotrichum zoysiae]|uniref:Uncharacterized protein n=1 Tax=Colletotrichum zoysiae TaxID=1216348 RepID=A0AAD9H865_9PEZI|nr:hypothetical protein LX32DRAFT_657043 [Colletotrichum zoysiae]
MSEVDLQASQIAKDRKGGPDRPGWDASRLPLPTDPMTTRKKAEAEGPSNGEARRRRGAESCIVVAADCRGENLTEEARLGGRWCEPGASAACLSSSRISVNTRQLYMA